MKIILLQNWALPNYAPGMSFAPPLQEFLQNGTVGSILNFGARQLKGTVSFSWRGIFWNEDETFSS